jgi:rhamnosyltransferase
MPANDAEVISVVIRVRNAAADLRRCLSALKTQEMPGNTRLDLVVVDNESTDASAEVAAGFGARLVSISAADFTWGRALNRGIAAAEGKTIILLSADASPADSSFLTQLIEPLGDPRVAAVYGRQIPRDDAPIDEWVRLRETFGTESFTWDNSGASPQLRAVISNACAAIRRSAWDRIRFDEVVAGEDRVWADGIVTAGYLWAYAAGACVYHSHRDGVRRWAYRFWELFTSRTSNRDKRPDLRSVLRATAGLAYARCRNCLAPGVPMCARIGGVGRLPFELLAVAWIAVLDAAGCHRGVLRRKMWDA